MKKKVETLMKSEVKQRFSLIKLNIGVCSVILGLLFIGGTGEEALADAVSQSKSDNEVVAQKSSSENEAKNTTELSETKEPKGTEETLVGNNSIKLNSDREENFKTEQSNDSQNETK